MSTAIEPDKEITAVLRALKEGGSLRYFALHGGGVAVHNSNDEPDRRILCSYGTFSYLRQQGLGPVDIYFNQGMEAVR
ncbi:MAG: hypothetical protein M3O22_04315 [Pseudomonadota bacterium]|nr:hypothetical protein [Pseudomonadota bacterium]